MPTITVTSAADRGPGSLRAAIAAAKSGDTIQFASSLKNQTITLTEQLSIPVGKNLVIDGATATGLTISGNNRSRILLLNSTSATPTSLTLKNLKLVNGYTNDRGGAISTTHQGRLTINNVTFNNNVADKGGGAISSAFEGTLTVTNSRFNGNRAIAANDELGGGAIAFMGDRALTVRNSEFRNNRGINGGAINSLNGNVVIANSRFINNDTTAAFFDTGKPNDFLRGYGGAIYTDRANNGIVISNSRFEGNQSRASGGAVHLFTDPEDVVTVTGSSFVNNQAIGLPGGPDGGKGGAFAHIRNALDPAGRLTISGSTFANNTGYDQGGGIWLYNAKTDIVNSTFSGNRLLGTGFSNVGGAMALYGPTNIMNTTIANNFAGWVGGGISAVDTAAVTVANTIFYNNTADNGPNKWGIQQHTNRELVDGGGNIQWIAKKTNNWNDYNATKTIRIIDPKLGPLQDNGSGLLTHALLAGSPAINTGILTNAPKVDQRGFVRDGQVDVGAFEAGATRLASVEDGESGGLPISGSNDGAIAGTPDPASVTLVADRLIGTAARDTLVAGAGDDLLMGRAGADVMTGGLGRDRFVYAGASQRSALAQSRVNAVDRIRDFNLAQGDRIQLDYDNNLATIQRPRRLFNAGKVTGRNLADAARNAYADKHQGRTGAQAIAPNEAVLFRRGSRTYLSVNDSDRQFSPMRDLVVDITGVQMTGRTAASGVLAIGQFFA